MTITLKDLKDAPLITELQGRGYRVLRDNDAGWMTLYELAEKVQRSPSSLCRTLRSLGEESGIPIDPPGIDITRSPRGRIHRVRPTDEFFIWLASRATNLPEARPRRGTVKTLIQPSSLVKETAPNPDPLRGEGGKPVLQ